MLTDHATDNEPDQELFSENAVRETAAASLLVISRLAISEYCTRRGHDPALLVCMQGEAVDAWAAAWGCETAGVESAISNIHAKMCDSPDIFDVVQSSMRFAVLGASGTRH